jgi:hypothetical protein
MRATHFFVAKIGSPGPCGPGDDEEGVVLSAENLRYTAAMSNKRSLLVLCARIGYNPPRR